MDNITDYIYKRLLELQDVKYREFQCKLIPNVDAKTVIGVRTPQLRSFAKELAKMPEADEFLSILPHKYYEENNLHGFLIERIRDYDRIIYELDRFLPYINNWATCDLISPKMFKKHLAELLEKIKQWVKTGDTYTVRFGIEMLMSFYLDEAFTDECMEIAASVKSDEYYVNMMIAWFFATALAKQYDAAFEYIKSAKLGTWTHNKAIQKAIESYRVSDERKTILRTYKIR